MATWTSENDWNGLADSSGWTNDGLGDHPTSDTIEHGYEYGSLTDGLVLYMPMEGNVFDGALGNHGDDNTSAGYVTGQVGSQAKDLDGTDDSVDAYDRPYLSFSATDDFTVALWVTIPAGEDGTQLFTTSDDNDYSTDYIFCQSYNSSYSGIRLNCEGDGNTSSTDLSGPDLRGGTWHHVAFVHNGTSDTARLFTDGVERDSATIAGAGTYSYDADWRFGGRAHGSIYFGGSMDDVRIYDRALSGPEIAALANLTSPSGVEVVEADVESPNVAWYEFNGDVTDSVGSNDGTDNTSAGYVDGIYGQAKDFDGADDYVDIPNNLGAFTSDFSVSMWFNTNTVSTRQIFFTANGENYVFIDVGSSTGTIRGDIYDGTTNQYVTGTVSANEWVHVLLCWDGETEYLYLNGSLVDSIAANAPTSTANDSRIGTYYDGTRPFDGQIDDVRIYDYALTPMQVELLHSLGAHRIERGDVL